MADNALIKILTALLKHQVKRTLGEETLGVIGQELAGIGGDKVDAWIGEQATPEQLEKAAMYAHQCFRGKVNDNDLEQWMVSLPLGNLPKVVEALEELPKSPDETKLENALQESVSLNWKNLSVEQVDNAVNAFISCLRSALLPIEKQTLMVIGRSVLRTEEKVNQLLKLVENLKVERQPSKQGEKQLNTGWYFGHRYGDIETFTGRTQELQMLNDWLDNKKDNLLVIRALGGFGKSALTWQWFNNNVDKAKWHTSVWWSFYEKESGFESFLTEALTHLGLETKDRSSRQQVNDLLNTLHKTNILIVLDGFERLLRQYGKMDAALQSDDEDAEIDPAQRDCTSQPAEIFLHGLSGKKIPSKVLMTTRLCPRTLEGKDGKLLKGCREEMLKAFSPEDAVTYFHNEGINATRAEIIEVCSSYGYHPLSLSLLVGLINENEEHRGDIVVARNLDIFGDIKAKRDHVLKRAYESLLPERRDLLSKISCFRGSMEYAILKKVFPSPNLDKVLLDLRKRGLLQYAGETQRYDMHPIVRHYAYDHFTDEKQRKEAHVQLAMHFVDAMPVTNTKEKTLEDLAPVIELYHHLVRAENLDDALMIFYNRLAEQLLYQFGAYQLRIELLRALFLDGEDKPPRLNREDAQRWTLNGLASTYSLSGQPRRAVPLYEMQNAICEKAGDKKNLAIGLGNVAGYGQLFIGALSAAERNLRRQIELNREIGGEWNEAVGHAELGRLLIYIGLWDESEAELVKSIKMFLDQQQFQYASVATAHQTLRKLTMLRNNTFQLSSSQYEQAISKAQQISQLLEQRQKMYGKQNVRDYILAYWLLGAAYRANNELTLAEENLFKAISICRQINNVESEANIILDLARLRYDQKRYEEAKSLAEEALNITERCGYVLQGADVNLFLAQYALEQEKDKAKAKEYAEEALKLATCDGPPYYYKVAYEEAERLIAQLQG